MTDRTNSLVPAAWMISAAFCFATMGAMTHAVGDRCDWLLIAFIRIFCTFVFSTALALAGGARLRIWKPKTLWWRSISGTISVACTFYALTRLPVADVLTLTNTYPLWIVLLSFLQGHGRGRATDLACVACGVLGVAIIQQPHGGGQGHGWAVSIALVASVTTAIAMLGLHRLKDVDARAVVAHFSGLASLSLALWLLVGHRYSPGHGMDLSAVLLLFGVGLTGTLGQVLLTKAYASGPPAKIAVLSLTQVIFGLGFDVLLQGRQLTLPTWLGFVMVLGPTAWVTSNAARRSRSAAPANRPVATSTEVGQAKRTVAT